MAAGLSIEPPSQPARRPIPIVATIVVVLAVLTMIGLGVWQLRRAAWKDGLIDRFAVARTLPPTSFPSIPVPGDALLFRRASGYCLQVIGWRESAGHNLAGEPGWRHVASCRTNGGEGPGLQVDMGWSSRADAPNWRGGRVEGVIGPDRDHHIMLVATTPAPGLVASAPPSLADVPNNHRSYAVQWFAFAAMALVIYALAIRKRATTPAPPGDKRPAPDGDRRA
jgi:surfeit locus 1 family protein